MLKTPTLIVPVSNRTLNDGDQAICPVCGSPGLIELDAHPEFGHKYPNWIAYNPELGDWECYECTLDWE